MIECGCERAWVMARAYKKADFRAGTYDDVVLVDVVPYVSDEHLSGLSENRRKIADPLKSFLGYVQNYAKENKTVDI